MTELRYLQSAASWDEALPLGNGRLGAMVFGGVTVERLQLIGGHAIVRHAEGIVLLHQGSGRTLRAVGEPRGNGYTEHHHPAREERIEASTACMGSRVACRRSGLPGRHRRVAGTQSVGRRVAHAGAATGP